MKRVGEGGCSASAFLALPTTRWKSHIFPKCCFPVVARVRKDHTWASWPQKRQKETLLSVDIFLIRTSILPLHQHPCILSLPGWTFKISFLLAPTKKARAGSCFVQTYCKQQRFSHCVSSKSQQKINCAVHQLGFNKGWKRHSFIFFLITLHGTKLQSQAQSCIERKTPYACSTWNWGRTRVQVCHQTVDGIWDMPLQSRAVAMLMS